MYLCYVRMLCICVLCVYMLVENGMLCMYVMRVCMCACYVQYVRKLSIYDMCVCCVCVVCMIVCIVLMYVGYRMFCVYEALYACFIRVLCTCV